MKKRGRGRGSNVNDEGKMTREKKVMTRGKRSKGKDWWGKSHTYRHFQSPPCLDLDLRMRNGSTMQTRFHYWENPKVGI
jgi:hypothetical protein